MTAILEWSEAGEPRSAAWLSAGGQSPPSRIIPVDDTLKTEAALHNASEGRAMLWRGDYHNARQLLQALARRIDRSPIKKGSTPAESFHLYRQRQGHRARVLGMLLLPMDEGYVLPLGRAPDVRQACSEVLGPPPQGASVIGLRELLGIIGAHQWRKKGLHIDALGAAIHPHYGVFSPVRGEYIELAATAPLPAKTLAFDIGTGTGVLAALLAKRGLARVIATENDPQAIACARENIARLGLNAKVEIIDADLFPPGRAPLIVCNPPWVPAKAFTPLERAVYDPDNRMLRGYLAGLAAHLEPGGEGWLILSDLAEHLGLRTREELLSWIAAGGLRVVAHIDTRPKHPKVQDKEDPLHEARAKEATSLWRLAANS
jgi:SAM-dependent methyltransferase